MTDSILILNAGSSSLKFALFGAADAPPILRGEIESLDTIPRLLARGDAGVVLADRHWSNAPPFSELLHSLLQVVDSHSGHAGLAAVGHRVVHGGADYVEPVLVTPRLRTALAGLTDLDPLHMPHNLAPIDAVADARPMLAQIVCFDTAFHHTLPPVAAMFALPSTLPAAVRRYGFHGLSYEYIARRLKQIAPALARGRVVVAHLGAGASLCALSDCISIDTTFGFSVLDGLVMATRCGTLDPGVIFHLARQGQDIADIEDMLYHRSGLLGVSGLSGDARVLLASSDPRAAAALDLFGYRAAAAVAGMACALGGLDGLVFTAGIGENAPAIRAAICARLTWLGVRLDPAANDAGAADIGETGSRVDIQIIATDEEAMIALHARTLLRRTAA